MCHCDAFLRPPLRPRGQRSIYRLPPRPLAGLSSPALLVRGPEGPLNFTCHCLGGIVLRKLALRMIWVGLAAASAVACGGGAVPQEALTAAQASVKGADVGGANEDPKAQLHLKLANEQIEKAKKLIEDGKNDEAARVIDRAQVDADLALALAQQAKALREAKDADEQLGKLKRKL